MIDLNEIKDNDLLKEIDKRNLNITLDDFADADILNEVNRRDLYISETVYLSLCDYSDYEIEQEIQNREIKMEEIENIEIKLNEIYVCKKLNKDYTNLLNELIYDVIGKIS